MLFEKYAGDKNIVKFEGNHNSQRPMFFFDSAVIFLLGALQVQYICSESNVMKKDQKQFWQQQMENRKKNNSLKNPYSKDAKDKEYYG